MYEDRGDESTVTLTALPSFGQPPKLHSCPYTVPPFYSTPAEADEEVFDGEFEFSLLINDPETQPPITADEIFSNGVIRPSYPLLANASIALREKPNRRQLIQLLMEEPDWSTSEVSSPYALESERISQGTYSLWPPDLSQCSVHTCCSSGSLFGRLIRNLVPLWSSSNREQVLFLSPEEKKRSTEKKVETERGKINGMGKKKDLTTAHQLFYGRNDRGETWKSSQPYKPEIWGFFNREF